MLDRGWWELRLPVRSVVWPSPPAVSRTFQGSRAEAEAALAELREQAEQGGPLRLDPTFGELLGAYIGWYEREVAAGVPGADIVLTAASAFGAEARTALGALRISVLTDGRAINEWELGVVDAGRPIHEVRELLDSLARVLGWGVAHGWIRRVRDPRSRITPPRSLGPADSIT